jgi:SAM-dependent methyltransferase
MLRATEMAHLVLRQILKPGDWVVDATVGNGYDTLWLAQIVGPSGRVFGFDVQAAALAKAAQRLHGLSHITLLHAGHEHLATCLPAEAKGRITGVMFNLGFLPGNDKSIVTRAETTLAALDQALSYLAVGGHITLVLYPGHDGGTEENTAVRTRAQRLSNAYTAARYDWINTLRPSPELVVIDRVA